MVSPVIADEESGDIALLWNEALRAYQDETNHDLSSESFVLSIATPIDLLKTLETKGTDFKDFRGKHGKLWSRLHSVVTPISKLGTVAQAGASLAPFGPAASAVLGGVVFLLTACNDVSSAYDWIENVFSELQGFAERLAQYAKSDMDTVIRRRVIAILVFFLRVLGRSEALVRDKRFKKYLKTVFLGEDSKTKSLLEDLNKETKGELEYVIASIYSTSKATLEATSRLEKAQIDNTDKILSTLKETTASRETEKEQAELKRALGTEAAEAVYILYSTFSENILKDSAMWLETESLYQAWQRRETPVLWTMGGPGSGKSYLMTKTIDNLIADHGQNHDAVGDTSVAFFFIKDGRAVQQDPRAILKTWALQISQNDAVYAKHALTCCRSLQPLGTTRDLWQRLFLDFYSSPKHPDHFAVLLLDGLDEAPIESRREILTLIESLLQSYRLSSNQVPRIQIAVFSRLDVRNDMSFLMRESYIEVSSKKNEHDMQRYIQQRLEQFSVIEILRRQKPNGHKKASKFAIKVMKKILEGADGVFLWAQLLLQEMEKKDQSQIEAILKDPPDKLDDMIADVCQRLANDKDLDQNDVRTMLLSVSAGFRDLCFAELHALVCLPMPETKDMMYDEIVLAPKPMLWNNVLSKFASFLNASYNPNYPPDDDVQKPPSLEAEVANTGQTETAAEGSAMPLDFTVSEDDEDESDGADDGVKTITENGNEPHVEETSYADYSEDVDEQNTEFLFSLSDSQMNASVSFRHLRIKDYLVLEGRASTRQHAPHAMVFDPDRVHIVMTIDCIRLLRLFQSVGTQQGDEEHFPYGYPMQYLFKHLESIDPAYTTELDEQRIISGLAWLFCTSQGAETALFVGSLIDDAGKSLVENLFGTNQHTHNVQNWLKKASKYMDLFDDYTQETISRASTSVPDLLAYWADAAARLWVEKDSPSYKVHPDTRWALFVLLNIAGLDVTGVMTDSNVGDWEELDTAIERQTENMILWLADWTQHSYDARWFTEVAIVLHAAGHDKTAAEYFQQALDKESTSFTAREGLAMCLGSQEHYKDALDQLIKDIESLSADDPDLPVQNIRLAELQLAADRVEGCVETVDKVFESAISDLESPDFGLCNSCVQILYKAKRSDKIIEILRQLDSLSVDSGPCLLDQYFESCIEVFQVIGRACRLQGKPAFVASAMDRIWERFQKSSRPIESIWLGIMAATMPPTYFDRTEDFLERTELILKSYESMEAMRNHPAYLLVLIYRAALASELFDRAVSAHPSQGALDDAAKIKGWSDKMSADRSLGLVPRKLDSWAAMPSLLYGRWLRACKQAPESEWRVYFRARILQQLALLDDDDPSNDAAALLPLAMTLFHAGDKQNAAAVLAMLYMPLEASKTKKQEQRNEESFSDEDLRALEEQTEELQLQVEDKSRCSCMECEIKDKDAEEMYICEVCLDMMLCGNCMPKRHNGGLSERSCNPAHEWHRAWPIPEEAKGIAARFSAGEGTVYVQKLWLDMLREEWINA